MKILLLISGYTCKREPWGQGDIGTPNFENMQDFFDGGNYLKKLLKNHNVKTICALWDNIGLKEVKKFYNPEFYFSYSQKEFQNKLKPILDAYEEDRIVKRNDWFKRKEIKNNLVSSSARVASQLYLRQIIAKKGIEFIRDHNYKPDIIILTRYDISCRGGAFIRNPSRITSSILDFFSKNKDYPKVVLPLFNQLNAGLPDMWFYLNLKGLYQMQFVYDEYLKVITSVDSKYKQLLTSGWPFSEFYNLEDTNDFRQFTNVMISKKKPIKLMKYKDWELPNIHTFLKYYMLLKKQKFKLKFISRYESLISMVLFSKFKNSLFLTILELLSGLKSKIVYSLKKIQLIRKQR